MKYISSGEFLRQSKEIQKVFTNWWMCDIGDLFVDKFDYSANTKVINAVTSKEILSNYKWYKKKDIEPLFTLQQLMDFIENKKGKITIMEFDYDHWNIVTKCDSYITDETDLLKVVWKVACEIAKKESEE